MTVEGNKLSEAKLKKYGKKVTQLRQTQRERAIKLLKNGSEHQADEYLSKAEKLARRMHNGG